MVVFAKIDRFIEDGDEIEAQRNATKTETGGMLTIVWGVVCAFLLIWMLYQGATAPPVVKTDLVFVDVEKPTTFTMDLSGDYYFYVFVRKETAGSMDSCATELNNTMTAKFPQAAQGMPELVSGKLELPACHNPGWQWYFQAVSKQPNVQVKAKVTGDAGLERDEYLLEQAWAHQVISVVPEVGEARAIMARNRDTDLNNFVHLNEGATGARAGLKRFIVQMSKVNGKVQFAGTGDFPVQAGGTDVYGTNTDMLYGTHLGCQPTPARQPDGTMTEYSAGGLCFKDAQCPFQPYTYFHGNAGYGSLTNCGPSGCSFSAYGQSQNGHSSVCSDPVSWQCGESTCPGGLKLFAFKEWNNGAPKAHSELIMSFSLPNLYQSSTTSSAFNVLEIIGSWGGQVGILTTVFAVFKKLLAKKEEQEKKRPSREACEMVSNPARNENESA